MRCTKADHLNQIIIGFCIDIKCPGQRPYCNFCLPLHDQHLNNLASLELLNGWIQHQIFSAQTVQKNVQECQSALDSLLNFLIPFSKCDIQQFSDLGLSQIDIMIKGLCQVKSCEETLFKKLRQSIEQTQHIIDEILKNIQKQTNQEEKPNLKTQYSDRKIIISEQPTSNANFNQFAYEIKNQNSIKQDRGVFAIAFNYDQSLVVAGYGKNIKVFQHLEGKLNQILLLRKHQNDVNTLNFMKQTNNFISGSLDNSIIIWQAMGENQWNCQYKLNGHSNSIFCVLLNDTDDIIISGSYDKTIKFWMKQNQWLCQQTISDHSEAIYSLSLNQQQNKLISCSKDSLIFIISKLDNLWSVTQKIKVDQYGYRLCFINDNLFTFQPYCKEELYLYGKDTNSEQYRKINEYKVKYSQEGCDCLFPAQYIMSKSLLVNKNGNFLNVMRIKDSGDFLIYQTIEFSSYCIYGQLSGDGEYLITYDKGSGEIQIRKYQEF